MEIPIASASMIRFGELWEKGINDLIREAGAKALEDAKLKAGDIGCLYIANDFSSKANGQSMLNSIAFEEIGIANSVCISAGDASGPIAIKEAANSILANESQIAMVLGVEKMTDLISSEMQDVSSNLICREESFAGATLQSQFALITRKYLHDFNLKPEDLSFIPSASHKNALGNEYAQYNFELPEEKINSSPLLADPIRALDCASYCDGAAALILCSGEAKNKLKNQIKGCLLASAMASDCLALSKRKSITTIESTVKAAAKAFSSACIKQDDVSLLEVHDFAPISEVLAVEDLGFAKKGSGIKFLRSNLEKINIMGGIKSYGHAIGATGVRQAADIINNLKRGEYGLTHTLGGTGAISAVNIFKGG